MGRAVTIRDGFVWRVTILGVVVVPRHQPPLRLDRRAAPVLAALDQARPTGLADVALAAAVTATVPDVPPNLDAWLVELVELLASVGLVDVAQDEL